MNVTESKAESRKTSIEGYLGNNRAELKGYPGVQTFMWRTENNITNFYLLGILPTGKVQIKIPPSTDPYAG